MKIIRFAVLSVAAALVLAACSSVPLPDRQVDMGLELACVPLMVRPPLRHLQAGEPRQFVGEVEVSGVGKFEDDDRFTLQSLTIPISLLKDVHVVEPAGGLLPDTYTFSDFVLTAELTDDNDRSRSLSFGPFPLDGTFTAEVTGDLPGEDLVLDLGDNAFVVVMQNVVSEIVVGTGTFSFKAVLEFTADLPEDTILQLTLDEGDATLRGRGSL